MESVAERLRVTVVELVYEAKLLMRTEPAGAVVSAGAEVVNNISLPYDVPALFDAAMR